MRFKLNDFTLSVGMFSAVQNNFNASDQVALPVDCEVIALAIQHDTTLGTAGGVDQTYTIKFNGVTTTIVSRVEDGLAADTGIVVPFTNVASGADLTAIEGDRISVFSGGQQVAATTAIASIVLRR